MKVKLVIPFVLCPSFLIPQMEKLAGLWLAYLVAEREEELGLCICASSAIAKITQCIMYMQVGQRLHAMHVPKVQRTVLIWWLYPTQS